MPPNGHTSAAQSVASGPGGLFFLLDIAEDAFLRRTIHGDAHRKATTDPGAQWFCRRRIPPPMWGGGGLGHAREGFLTLHDRCGTWVPDTVSD